MPKIIDALREKLLTEARTVLLGQGYRALTIRGVAGACGVAAGTVYNYFPSKDMLAAAVMLEDWQSVLSHAREACATACDVRAGLLAIHRAIGAFAGRYRLGWGQVTMGPGFRQEYQHRHQQLMGQIAGLVEPLLRHFGCEGDPFLAEFTARMLLTLSMDETFEFERLDGIITRLYAGEEREHEQL